MSREWQAPGFYGKLPTMGDFVTRRVPLPVIEPFNDWLEAGILASRRVLGDGWLDAFLVAPVWHFAFEAGVCGDVGLCGVLVPSVDKVGRYFPLALLAPLPAEVPLLAWAEANGDWCRQAEGTLLDALDSDLDVERFDARVRAVGTPLPSAPPGRTAAALTEVGLRQGRDQLGLAWTRGATGLPPTLAAFAVVPDGDSFTGFLNGRWGDDPASDLSVLPLTWA